MPDLAKIEAVAEKFAGAEPAPDPSAAAPPDGTGSGAGSAPADAATDGGGAAPADPPASPGATTFSAAEVRAKLEADRQRRAERARAKQAEEDRAAAKRAREEAEAERAKFKDLGKGKSFLETIKELGKDPREAFEEMKREALLAGTPEGKIEALQRAFDQRLEALDAELKAEKEARAAERTAREAEQKRIAEEQQQAAFVSDFKRAYQDPRFESLATEYPPERLHAIVASLATHPDTLFDHAAELGVDLTSDDGSFTMIDIFNVCLKTQERHQAYADEQRRKREAAPQTSQGGQQRPEAKKPPVNGTVERKAATVIGNDVATERASDPPKRKESREERLRRLGDKYG